MDEDDATSNLYFIKAGEFKVSKIYKFKDNKCINILINYSYNEINNI